MLVSVWCFCAAGKGKAPGQLQAAALFLKGRERKKGAAVTQFVIIDVR